MAFDSRLNADLELFEQIRFIPVGNDIILKPIIIELFEQEAKIFLLNTKTEEIKKYLPLIYVETIEQAKEKLYSSMQSMLFRGSLFYCIRFKEQQFPIGYINLNTPIAPTGLHCWTVDFWLGETAQGNGIMTASLYYLLTYLKQFNIPEIKAVVHADNIKALNVINKVGFAFSYQESEGEKRIIYSIRLK